MMSGMSEHPNTVERRRSVRMRPLPELPAKVSLLVDSGPVELQLWDISVGGLAITGHSALSEADVRHLGGGDAGLLGMQLAAPPPQVTSAVGRYVAELLERGAPS